MAARPGRRRGVLILAVGAAAAVMLFLWLFGLYSPDTEPVIDPAAETKG